MFDSYISVKHSENKEKNKGTNKRNFREVNEQEKM